MLFTSMLAWAALFAQSSERVPVAPPPEPPQVVPTQSISVEIEARRSSPAPGTIQRWTREPFPGALVEIGYSDAGTDFRGSTLGIRRTDAKGLVRASFEVPVVNEDDPPLLWARIVEPGWQQRVSTARVRLDRAVRFHVRGYRGATARGRCVDENGTAVGGKIALMLAGQVLRDPAEVLGEGSRVSSRRGLEVHFSESGNYTLLARAPGFGSARLSNLTLDLDAPQQDLMVVVRGEGVLNGTVTNADGEPIAGLLLRAAATSSAVDRPDADRSWIAEHRSGGVSWITAQTDEAGAFHFGGLRPEPYNLRTDARKSGSYDTLLTPTPVAPTGERLELALQEPLIRVRVLEPTGEPIAFNPTAKEAQPQFLVRESDGLGRATGYVSGKPWQPTPRPEQWDLFLEPGQSYLLACITPAAEVVMHELHVGQNDGMRELDVRLPRQTSTATLRVTAENPPGRERPTPGQVKGYIVNINDAQTGFYLRRYFAELHETSELEMPPGSYEIEVEPWRESVLCGTGMTPVDFAQSPLGHTEIVQLAPAGEMDLHVRFTPAASLYAGVSIEGDDASQSELRVLIEATSEAGETRVLGFWDIESTRTLMRSGAELIEPIEVDWITPGDWQEIRAPISPGRWTLEAHAPGFEGVPIEVTLENRECRRVELKLRRP